MGARLFLCPVCWRSLRGRGISFLLSPLAFLSSDGEMVVFFLGWTDVNGGGEFGGEFQGSLV